MSFANTEQNKPKVLASTKSSKKKTPAKKSPKKKAASKPAGGVSKSVEKKKPKRPPKQKHFPGMEPKTYKDVEQAALTYEKNRDARLRALKEEIDLKGKLLDAMKKHKLKEYKFDGRVVVIEMKAENVKVNKVKQPKALQEVFGDD